MQNPNNDPENHSQSYQTYAYFERGLIDGVVRVFVWFKKRVQAASTRVVFGLDFFAVSTW